MKQINEKHFIVGPVRLSYLNVFATRHNDQRNEDEYDAVLLFPKENGEHQPDAQGEIKAVQQAIVALKNGKFGADFKGVWASALKDGDKELRKNDGEPKNPGYWYMNVRAKAQYPPKLMDGNLNVPKKEDWTSGDWGLVKVSLFPYDTAGNKGVGAGLIGVQFLFKDEPLGGGSAADEGFGAIANAHAGSPTATQSNPDEYDPFSDSD